MSKPSFTVVIPAWNEADHIEATIRSVQAAIAQQHYPGNIIVVDNNSSDNTAELAEAAGASVVFEPINQIARARNAGANASKSDWLVFVDADTTITAALLSASLTALSSGAVIGGGSTVAMDKPLTGVPIHVLRFWNWVSVKTQTAAGCYIYSSKEAFNAVGGFNERHYAAEELHLSKRLRKLAKKRSQQFVIQTIAPVVSSSRKVEWFSTWQCVKQVLLLSIPGATRSRVMCYLWYDRSKINKRSHSD